MKLIIKVFNNPPFIIEISADDTLSKLILLINCISLEKKETLSDLRLYYYKKQLFTEFSLNKTLAQLGILNNEQIDIPKIKYMSTSYSSKDKIYTWKSKDEEKQVYQYGFREGDSPDLALFEFDLFELTRAGSKILDDVIKQCDMEMLSQFYALKSIDHKSVLKRAIHLKQPAVVKSCLRAGLPVDQLAFCVRRSWLDSGLTYDGLLLSAIKLGNSQIVDLLLRYGGATNFFKQPFWSSGRQEREDHSGLLLELTSEQELKQQPQLYISSSSIVGRKLSIEKPMPIYFLNATKGLYYVADGTKPVAKTHLIMQDPEKLKRFWEIFKEEEKLEEDKLIEMQPGYKNLITEHVGHTPISDDHQEVIKLLLAYGADPGDNIYYKRIHIQQYANSFLWFVLFKSVCDFGIFNNLATLMAQYAWIDPEDSKYESSAFFKSTVKINTQNMQLLKVKPGFENRAYHKIYGTMNLALLPWQLGEYLLRAIHQLPSSAHRHSNIDLITPIISIFGTNPLSLNTNYVAHEIDNTNKVTYRNHR